MASAFAHAVSAVALSTAFPESRLPRWTWAVGAVCAGLPDLDFVAFDLGIPYDHVLGHRGLSHSLPFAALVAGVALWAVRAFRTAPSSAALLLYFFLCAGSHGLIDAMTDGGLGIAFFAPFSGERYFLPWRPITVAPIGVLPFFSQRGWEVLCSEALWVGIPSLIFAVAAVLIRKGVDWLRGDLFSNG